MKTSLAQVLLLVLAVGVVYWPTLGNGYVWDDETNFHENATLKQPDALRRIWMTDEIYQYYPLTFTSYHLEYLACGGRFVPWVTHLLNAGLHAANAVLLLFLCRRLGLGCWAAWLAAAIFAVHPIEVESVAWATERKNLLGGLFFLGSFLAYARLAGTRRKSDYVLSLMLFVLAGLSKTVTMTLPVSLILFERLIHRARFETLARRLIPFFVLAIGFAVLARNLEHDRAGAAYLDLGLNPLDRVLIACRVPWHYAWNILIPRSPVFIPPRWPIDAGAAASYWPVLLTGGLAVILVMARRRLPLTVLAAGHYLVTLLPAAGLVDFVFMRYSFAQDHFQYLAGIGILIIVSQVAAELYQRGAGIALRGLLAGIMVTALLFGLGAISRDRCHDFRSSETLWRDTLGKNPAAWLAAYNLGILVAERGDAESLVEAAELYMQVIHYNARHFEAYNNLGSVQARLGHDAEAMESFEQSIHLRPESAEARINLAHLLARNGRIEEARLQYETALSLAEAAGRTDLIQEIRGAVPLLRRDGS